MQRISSPQLFPSEKNVSLLMSFCSCLDAHCYGHDPNGDANSLMAFVTHFKEIFGQTSSDLSVNNQLFWLRQGKSTVSDYTLQFRTLVATSGYHLQHQNQCKLTLTISLVRSINRE